MRRASLLGSWTAGSWTVLAVLTTVLGTTASAAPQPQAAVLPKLEPKDLDLRKGWFKPVTTKDADTICGTLTADARRYFLSTGDWSQYAAWGLAAGTGLAPIPADDAARSALGLHGLVDEPAQWVLERPKQSPLFLYFHARANCTTGCNVQRLIVSNQRITNLDTAPEDSVTTPPAESWTLYYAASGAWYAAGLIDQHLQLYALTTPSQWHLACDVALAPYHLHSTLDADVRGALAAVSALYSSTRAFIPSAESCRRNISLQRSFEQALYRPWQWLQQDNAAGYQQVLARLNAWSAKGANEAAALDRYAAELSNSVATVQHLYTRKFGWSIPAATRVAYDALTGVIGSELDSGMQIDPQCMQGSATF